MLFNSQVFFVFFSCFLFLYWLINRKSFNYQNYLILVGSYIFYAWWDWRFLFLIFGSSLIDFFVAKKIHNGTKKLNWLIVSCFSNLGTLFVFKYFNFFTQSFIDLTNLFGFNISFNVVNIILPVGISFYTFQTLSYSIDVYRNKISPTSNLISFLSFVSFFPQLVAGPIERASNLIPQIESKRTINVNQFKAGFFQILVGLFRKIVVADNLALYVDLIYGDPQIYNSSTLLLATFLYAFQIYFDFSGYSDIAIGTAKLLGFNFKQNFNLPYFSNSLTEFWRRWHISLSSWLKDYLYISLGGNRKGKLLTYRNLILTMLLGGLWHGSSFNFIIWGLIHGFVLAIEKLIFSNKQKTFGYSFGFLYTFPVVLISWVFFRSQTLDDSFFILSSIFYFDFSYPVISDISIIVTSFFVLLIGLVFDILLKVKKTDLETFGMYLNIKVYIFYSTFIIMLLVLFYSSSEQFIYFQF
jgi:alginate O-acetyltransferase complex protein AlgI